MDIVWLEFLLIAVGIIANGFFAGSEIALVSARKSRLAQLAQGGNAGAVLAVKLKESPDTFLATIQIAITIVGTLASAVGGATAVDVLTPRLGALGSWAQPVALGIVIVVITYFSLVIGELVPKAIALRDPEWAAALVARPVAWLSRIAGGAVRVLTASTNAALRLLGLSSRPESVMVSEEEVRYLLREGAARGVFEKVEQELVENVFEFTETTVREIMVPRVKIQGIDVETPPADVLPKVAAIAHSWIVVYRASVEHIVGVLSLKGVVSALVAGRPLHLTTLVRQPLFMPETANVSRLLRELQRTRQPLAIVVDEYGSVVGLVTIDDAVARIVGEVRERAGGPEDPAMTRLPDGSIVVDGLVRIEDLKRAFGLAIEESPDYATVAGFVLTSLGRIPSVGATLMRNGYRWTVLQVDGPRITRVKVERVADGR